MTIRMFEFLFVILIYNKVIHVIIFETTVHCLYVNLFNELTSLSFHLKIEMFVVTIAPFGLLHMSK
jgi:hypothetical protein